MRVIMVTGWYPTVSSPVTGIFVRRDAELIATAHDVEVVHLVEPGRLTADDVEADRGAVVPVTRVAMSRARPRDVQRARATVADRLRGADLLHTQAFSTLLPLVAQRFGRPWVHSEHWSGLGDPTTLTPRGRAVLRVTAPLLRRPDVVTAVSTHLADQVRPHRGGRPVAVVPSVVPAAPAVPAPHDPSIIRLVGVGGLVDGKDPLLALATVQELARRGVRASLTWAGDGPLYDAMARAARPGDDLTLLGAVDAAGVGDALDAADIFLLPTRGETLCLSAIEAITRGRPVVLGARGGQRDYVSSANGVLVAERTPQAYADAVLDLWERRTDLTAGLVAATIGDRFQAPRVLAGYDAVYAQARDVRKGHR